MIKSTHSFKTSAICVALAASLLTGAAIAKGPYGDRGGKAPIERMIQRLDLTDEQIPQIEALFEARRGDRKANKARRNQIQELVSQGSVEQAADLAAEAARERVFRMAEFKNALSQILTPEQVAKMEQAKERRRERMERRNYDKNADRRG